MGLEIVAALMFLMITVCANMARLACELIIELLLFIANRGAYHVREKKLKKRVRNA